MEIRQQLDKLAIGDFLDYNKLCKSIDKTPEAELEEIYSDSTGHIEAVNLEGEQVMVIEALNGSPMVRDVKKVGDE